MPVIVHAHRVQMVQSGDCLHFASKAGHGLGPTGDGPGFGIKVALSVEVPRLDSERAERLVQSAHKVCPYSNAIRDNVDVELDVRAGSEAATPA